MAELITSFQSVFSTLIGNVGTVATTVTSTPILLVGAGTIFAYAGVKLFKMVLH